VKLLQDLPWEEAEPIYRAYHERKPLEFLAGSGWADRTKQGPLQPEAIYRVKATKPSIDWSHLKPEIVAIAEDREDDVWGFGVIPTWSHETKIWVLPEGGGSLYTLEGYASYVPGTCAPEDSLVLRHGVESDGWIEWHGGECPVGPTHVVEIAFSMGDRTSGPAEDFRWSHVNSPGDIVRYRLVTPAPAQPGCPA
jgi:hypothetical protein